MIIATAISISQAARTSSSLPKLTELKASALRTKKKRAQYGKKRFAHPGPAVVEFVVRKEENVYPMVAQGSTIDEMIMGDSE